MQVTRASCNTIKGAHTCNRRGELVSVARYIRRNVRYVVKEQGLVKEKEDPKQVESRSKIKLSIKEKKKAPKKVNNSSFSPQFT